MRVRYLIVCGLFFSGYAFGFSKCPFAGFHLGAGLGFSDCTCKYSSTGQPATEGDLGKSMITGGKVIGDYRLVMGRTCVSGDIGISVEPIKFGAKLGDGSSIKIKKIPKSLSVGWKVGYFLNLRTLASAGMIIESSSWESALVTSSGPDKKTPKLIAYGPRFSLEASVGNNVCIGIEYTILMKKSFLHNVGGVKYNVELAGGRVLSTVLVKI